MPFVTNRGQRIHYTVDGDGPLVVLQHGYLSSAADWKTCGYVDVLTEAGFRVACVDSLAHGESDKPTDPDLYALPHRADDIVAVLDDLGADRAHLVGYSMGGWIAGGVATHHPERLASVTIAGWDCVRGVDAASGGLGHHRRRQGAARGRPRHRARHRRVGHPRGGGGGAHLWRRHHRRRLRPQRRHRRASPCRCCAGTAPRTRTTAR